MSIKICSFSHLLRKNPLLEKLNDKITNPYDYFNIKNSPGEIYKALREKLFELLPKWRSFGRIKVEN